MVVQGTVAPPASFRPPYSEDRTAQALRGRRSWDAKRVPHPGGDIQLPTIIWREDIHQLSLKIIDQLTDNNPFPGASRQALDAKLIEEL